MKATCLTLAFLFFICCWPRASFSQNGILPSEFNLDSASTAGLNGEITGGVVGQPFGQPLGQSFGQRPNNSTFSGGNQSVGVLRADSRFQRGARRANQFVGSDSGEQRSFVGAVQATTNTSGVSSVTGLPATSGPSAASTNRARQASRGTAKYDPTLIVAFDRPTEPAEQLGQDITERFAQFSDLRGCQVSVQVDGRIAMLQGVVGSANQRRFAELYLQMEPGISSVDNQLRIADPMAPALAPNSEAVPREQSRLEILPQPPTNK